MENVISPLPFWVFDLFCYKIKGVPTWVREEGRVEGKREVSHIPRGTLKGILKVLSVSCGAEVGGRPGERKRGEEYGEDKGFRGRIKKMKQMRGGEAKTNRTGEEKKNII